MVEIKYKFHSHGKKGKWYSQKVKTFAEAKEVKKMLNPKDKVVVMSRGKFVDVEKIKPRTRKKTISSGYNNVFGIPENPFGL